MAALLAIRDILVLVIPLLAQFLKALFDKETREAVRAVNEAKSEEEKREAIVKFANALSKSS